MDNLTQKSGICKLDPEPPFIWEGKSPQERERLWKAAIEWFDRAAAAMHQRERAARLAEQRRRSQRTPVMAPPPADPLMFSAEEAREARRDQRVLRWVRRYRHVLAPEFFEWTAGPIGQLVGQAMEGACP